MQQNKDGTIVALKATEKPIFAHPMKQLLFVFCACWISFSAHGQPDSTFVQDLYDSYWQRTTRGSVVYHQSDAISSLMDTLAISDLTLDGYRIQLAFGKKNDVTKIRTSFLQAYPDYRAYVSWLQPNFRLRVGDFRTRLQAERFKWEILEEYPNSYIVKDAITPVAP